MRQAVTKALFIPQVGMRVKLKNVHLSYLPEKFEGAVVTIVHLLDEAHPKIPFNEGDRPFMFFDSHLGRGWNCWRRECWEPV